MCVISRAARSAPCRVNLTCFASTRSCGRRCVFAASLSNTLGAQNLNLVRNSLQELTAEVEALLATGRDPKADRSIRNVQGSGGARDKTRVVSYRVPHNAALQVYDYKSKQARVVFGPDLVLLGPDEQFTLLSLSGDKPKRENVIKSLCLLLGPDFMTDIVTVETSDHARLSLQLSYNW